MRIIYPAFIAFPNQKANAIHTAKNCESFTRHGAEVELVVPSRRRGAAEDPFAFYGLKEHFTVTKIWSPVFFLSTRIGYTLSTLLYSVVLFFFLLRRRGDFDALYLMELEPLGFLTLPLIGKPYFLEMHAPRRPRNLHYLFLFTKIAGLVVLNDAIKQKTEKRFPWLRGKVLVCPSALDLNDADIVSKDAARRELKLPSSAAIGIYTGSFISRKGLQTVLEAAAKLPDINFYLVGGEQRELGGAVITKNVTLVGKRPYQEMPYWRSTADFLIASGTNTDWYSKSYTSPMKLLEYMSSKRPILVARTDAMAFVIGEDEAVFYEPDDANSLQRAITWVLEHREEALSRALRAYERAKDYSWDSRATKILAFITDRTRSTHA
ncbi:MAG TPA: glycosyltransferase [Candidatus Paceibacterota bacterium]